MNHEFKRLQELSKLKNAYLRAYMYKCQTYESYARSKYLPRLLDISHNPPLPPPDSQYPQNYEIVVSHYNEPIGSLELFRPFDRLVTLYHKGDWEESRFPKWIQPERIIRLPNVGRESHTYLHHIINRWDSLSYNTFFSQAGYDDHYNKNEVLPLCYYLCSGPMEHREYTANLIHHRLGLPRTTTEKSMNDWWNRLQITPNHSLTTLVSNKSFQWAPGGIFSVTKNRIQHRPLSFYRNIIDTLDSSSDPITGHYCERAWGYIFNI